MKELLLRRKGKFIQYLFATFLFVGDHFAQMGIFVLLLRAIEKGDSKHFGYVVAITVLFIFYAPINFLISRLLRIRYMRDTILDVRKQAFDKIINMPFKKFSARSKEIYISNLINDINTFENKFFISLLNYLINIIMFLLSILILAFLDYKLAIAMALQAVILTALATVFVKKASALETELSECNENFTTDMANTFNGMEILKLNHIEEKFKDKSMESIKRAESKKFAAAFFTDMQKHVIRIISFASSVAVMIYLAYSFLNGLSLSMGGFLFQLCSSSGNYLINAFPMRNQMKASMTIYRKIAEPDENSEEQDKGSEEFCFHKEITLKAVSFSYGKKEILKDAAFTIEKGKKYLIKGPSGAGKSTLINLLAKVTEDYRGEISADGIDFRRINEKSFHSKVAFVYQDVFLFEDTIRNNIALYQEVPEEKIQFAVKVCGLEGICGDKKAGIDEMLSENGKNLSGGQRQRISIARAIAKDAEILFVDEGTSSLNEELGREIERVFLNLENTVIAISHRYYEGVTDRYDYVLEIKNGRVHQFPAQEYFHEVVVC
ncbi:ABC-type multidrug transport system, ATPase and permease component [Anaerocolumna jejuensis DSM 15929]|uniref:ABC-type multidrug transport system, ATPase and permease component n=1 Tax=Anaerocolumna jejuensis DSM 15929 TaxID=1121322 RepID=A0A1M6PIS1_9FIRM|nr:ABC transporter ATP-binding protein [Anaerocolumna jejuensis]SHK07800.1 ABC-type multidrug transport system, ATPase and permease component [Anaerocolumna jejuensis DSM 15929]